MKVTLASASPRRRELVKKIDWVDFDILPSFAEEVTPGEGVSMTGEKIALVNAERKAREVYSRAGGTVLGADTVVEVGGRVLGKPRDRKEAEDMFRLLCGRTHTVVTGIFLLNEHKSLAEYEKSYVTFRAFDAKIVYNYIESGAPFDKAGGYGLQDGLIAPLIARTEGDRDNIIGFPLRLVEKMLKEFV